MNQIDFNSISNYHNWPKTLLDNVNLRVKHKTKDEVIREYGDEKWTQIHTLLKNNPGINLNQLEELINKEEELNVSVIMGNFFETSNSKINEIYMEILKNTLLKYSNQYETIVEIGAGYGSKILQIASGDEFINNKFIAGELTHQGQGLIKNLASNMDLNMNVGYCDILNGDYSELKIPHKSIIFSSYAAQIIPDFKKFIYKKILDLNPSIIIHFEPIYESLSSNNIYELMCRKYIEINNYNTNLLETIKSLEMDKLLSFTIQKNVLGSNPFLPVSIIECKPKNK